MQNRPRIAWFSSVTNEVRPTGDSIAAYFSDLIIPYLVDSFVIDRFCEPDISTTDGLFPLSDFENRFRRQPYDIIFYNLENSTFSKACLEFSNHYPGIAIVHDLPDHFTTRRIMGSHRLLFSTERNLREFKLSAADAGRLPPVTYLPYPVDPSLGAGREQLQGMTPRTMFRVGFYGTVNLEHRAHKLLKVLSDLGYGFSLLWLVAAEETDAARNLIDEFGFAQVELQIGRSPAGWGELVQSIDCAVHTFFSASGDVGPYLQISMMAGVPTIVTNFAGSAELPDATTFKIRAGDREELELAERLRAVAGAAPAERRKMGTGGMEFACEFHDARLIAAELKSVFLKSLGLSQSELRA